MKLGDIRIEKVVSAKTGKITEIRHVITQEEVDKHNKKTEQQKREEILKELNKLDKVISRIEEDIIFNLNMELHPSKQSIIDKKQELRSKLK